MFLLSGTWWLRTRYIIASKGRMRRSNFQTSALSSFSEMVKTSPSSRVMIVLPLASEVMDVVRWGSSDALLSSIAGSLSIPAIVARLYRLIPLRMISLVSVTFIQESLRRDSILSASNQMDRPKIRPYQCQVACPCSDKARTIRPVAITWVRGIDVRSCFQVELFHSF